MAADWKSWRTMARESIKAARDLQQSAPRSSVSRFYYAAYQSVTAVLLYLGQQPPQDREAWSHADTPQLLMEHFNTAVKSADTRKDLRNRLRQLYKVRIEADYVGNVQLGEAAVKVARKDATYLVKIADDVLPKE